MKDQFLYQRIANSIRMDIMEGRYRPGDRLPSIRILVKKWGCTPGTVQRAYLELAGMGLVTSQPGKGTHVISSLDPQVIGGEIPMRRARLVHEAEAFILASISTGYSTREIQNSITHALDRWRSIKNVEKQLEDSTTIHFSGSHDLVMTWIADHMEDILPGVALELQFTGSLGGLIAVAEGRADLSGSHLLDFETDTYNQAYVRKLFPGKKMAMLVLAERRLGFMVLPGNPKNIRQINDLIKSGVRMVNRQQGSGTRVWLDFALGRNGIDAKNILGYQDERMTHSEVARCIAEGVGDVGIGLESAAADFRLEFQPLTSEIYHIVTTVEQMEKHPVSAFIEWLRSSAKTTLPLIPGYDYDQTGNLSFVR